LVDEDYSSVQSGEIVSDTFKTAQWFKKNPAEDTISAMIILERWKKNGTIENPSL
jgi:RNase H-fold protein (predicted Holliday junction resolvase)